MRSTQARSPASRVLLPPTSCERVTLLAGRAVTMRCMSSESGSTARLVIDAERPSTKKSTPQKSPMPKLTPITADRVRRGLRHRSVTSVSNQHVTPPPRVGPHARVAMTRSARASDVRVVGDESRGWPRSPADLSKNGVDHPVRIVTVERSGGFVSEDDGRSVDNRAGDGDPLALAAREVVGEAAAESSRGRVARATRLPLRQLQRPAGRSPAAGRRSPPRSDGATGCPPGTPSPGFRGGTGSARFSGSDEITVATDGDSAGGRRGQSSEQAEQGRLPASARTHDRHALAAVDLEPVKAQSVHGCSGVRYSTIRSRA